MILLWLSGDPGAIGIEMDVADQLKKIVVGVYEHGYYRLHSMLESLRNMQGSLILIILSEGKGSQFSGGLGMVLKRR